MVVTCPPQHSHTGQLPGKPLYIQVPLQDVSGAGPHWMAQQQHYCCPAELQSRGLQVCLRCWVALAQLAGGALGHHHCLAGC
jgi:hypothetical protein